MAYTWQQQSNGNWQCHDHMGNHVSSSECKNTIGNPLVSGHGVPGAKTPVRQRRSSDSNGDTGTSSNNYIIIIAVIAVAYFMFKKK